MRKNSYLIAFMLTLLVVGSAWAATTKHPAQSNKVLQMSGKVQTVTSNELTLSSKSKGQSGQETFVINPQTKTEGSLSTGESVTVRYKNENGQKNATMIRAHKMASSSPSSSSASSTTSKHK